jgi:oligogalacturonide lyase
MSKGSIFPSEAAWSVDRVTGARVRQITSESSVNHPSYFLHRCFLPGDARMFFTSYRSLSPQLYLATYPDGDFVQLTDGPAIHPFSAALRPGGDDIVFARGGSFWSLSIRDFREERIVEVPGAQFGEPSISADGDWITAAYRLGEERGIAAGRIDGTGWLRIPYPRTVIHPQFHPLEPDWIEFAADPAPRMHRVRRDGTGLECLYEHGNDEFVVHETFLGPSGDLVFTIWPQALCRMDWTTRAIRQIAAFNAWHIAPNRAGTAIVCDTNHPDEGIQLVDVESGTRRLVCLSESSNRGSQWATSRYALPADFAAARSQSPGTLSWMESDNDTVYGPQWSHPHPSWSTDERKIAFASDRSGSAQVYVAEIPGLPKDPERP